MIRFDIVRPEYTGRCSICGAHGLTGAFIGPRGGIKLQICEECLSDTWVTMVRYIRELEGENEGYDI